MPSISNFVGKGRWLYPNKPDYFNQQMFTKQRIKNFCMLIFVMMLVIYLLLFLSNSMGTTVQYDCAKSPESSIEFSNFNNRTLILNRMITRITFPQLHKTGSTTFASILVRLAWRYGLEIYAGASKQYQVKQSNEYSFWSKEYKTYEIEAAHIADTYDMMNFIPDYDWSELYNSYQLAVPCSEMIITIREPYERYLSMIQLTSNRKKLSSILQSKLVGGNHLSRSLGILSEVHAYDFINSQEFEKTFFIITEYFDESLILLKNKFHWNMQDLLYIELNDGCKSKKDGSRIGCKKSDDIDKSWIKPIKSIHNLDYIIYNAALKSYEAEKSLIHPEVFVNEVQFLKLIVSKLTDKCGEATSTSASSYPTKEQLLNDPCVMYLVNDTKYNEILNVDRNGHFIPEFDPMEIYKLKLHLIQQNSQH
jgi:hypothetical protein